MKSGAIGTSRRWAAVALTGAWLSGCATAPRLYSVGELSGVDRSCSLEEGDLIQEEDAPELLFLYRVGPTPAQIACTAHWAKKHHLHLAMIDAVNWNDTNAPAH